MSGRGAGGSVRSARSRGTLALVAVALALGAIFVASASAAVSRFGSAGESSGQFIEPFGIGVDQSSGAIYIADRNNDRTDKFGPEGEFDLAWGWGVAGGAAAEGESCSLQCFAGLEGEGTGQFSAPKGVAVDNGQTSSSRGDVYVVDAENHRVEKFTDDGVFLLMIGGGVNRSTGEDVCDAGGECGAGSVGPGAGEFEPFAGNVIAVAESGEVYVGDSERVQKFKPNGALVGEIALAGSGSIEALAINKAGDLYVKSSGLTGVHEYDGTGTEIGEPRDATGTPEAIALGTAGELFVVDSTNEQHHIYEYNAAGTQTASFDSGGEVNLGLRGIAFYGTTGNLYVLNASVVRVVTPPPPGPLVVAGSESASEVGPTSATLNATINPEGGTGTEYHFDYGTTDSYGTSTEELPVAGEVFGDHHVEAAVAGLQPNTTYHFRVVATNAANETTVGPDEVFTTQTSALIEEEAASEVTATSAALTAKLNPLGLPTEYRFEYGTSTAYGSSVPTPDAEAGSGTTAETIRVLLAGLTPGVTYHYRVVAHNARGIAEGHDATFRTQAEAPSVLPDGRSWELVSPIEKRGVSLESIPDEGGVIQASSNGDAITYIASAPIVENPAGNRSIANTQVLSERGSASWSTEDISSAHEAVAGLRPGFRSEYQLFSSDLSAGALDAEGATPLSAETTERTPYLRESDGAFKPLVTAANVPAGTEFGGTPPIYEDGTHFITATPDLSHILLKAPIALTPGFTANGHDSLYEWSAGTLQLVSILPNKVPAAEEGETSSAGATNRVLRGALSDGGNRVAFTTENNSGQAHLYLRDLALKETVQLDASHLPGNKGGGHPVFQDASEDGNKVFFTDDARLTPNSTAVEGEATDLYMCEIEVTGSGLTCALKDISIPVVAGETADVRGFVLGTDTAARFVYFVANGVLAPGGSRGTCVRAVSEAELIPPELSCDLYRYDTVTGQTIRIAVLANRDRADWEAGGNGDLGGMTASVSPSGQFVAFMSQRSLTGYDNHDANSGALDDEVFLYDSSANDLRCASCNPSGARPTGIFDHSAFPGLLVDRPRLWAGQWLAASIPGWTRVDNQHALYQSRYLSDSGRLFFNSQDALVPQDANGKEDVYEYEPSGVGDCATEGGCVHLISSGTSNEESAFLDASQSGDDVFFLTAAKLSSDDVDDALDVYDARVCTAGSPCLTGAPAGTTACLSTDACRAAPSPQPNIFGAPPSQLFSGAGNLAPPPPVKSVVKPAVKKPTRAQLLKKALAACKKKPKRKQAACNRTAKKRYGPVHASKSVHVSKKGRRR